MSIRAVIQGIGHAVPDNVLTNAQLEKIVDTTDDWIIQRTGIKERRVSRSEESTFTFALGAAQNALANAQFDPADLDLIVCGTVTPDMFFPATACLVQDAVGAKKAGAYDLSAACAGFIYSLANAAAMIESGAARNALVIGADTLTKFVDWQDRGTCILFGDGAGAVLLKGEENTDRGVLKTVLLSDGSGGKHINIAGGGSRAPYRSPQWDTTNKCIYMAGSEVYRFAVTAMGDACCKALDLAGLTEADIDLFVPHQANLRIIESAAKRLKLPPEKVFINVDRMGNTSGGSIPIGLSEAVEQGRLKKGQLVMTVGFGAGLVWGANLIRW